MYVDSPDGTAHLKSVISFLFLGTIIINFDNRMDVLADQIKTTFLLA